MAGAGIEGAGIRGTGEPRILFLSYSSVDREAAFDLKQRLEASEKGRAAGLKVWVDRDDLAAGPDWMEQLERAIGSATAFAVYVGTKGVVTWVRREVRLALVHATDSDHYPFIPILADDSVLPQLPDFARQHQGVTDPLARPAEMEKLLRAILGEAPDVPLPLIDRPFVGLRAMDEKESDRFFGREAELDDLIEKLARPRQRMVAVIADSGTGKSSLVRAGLIPAWRRHELAVPGQTERADATWHVVLMRPGRNPEAELAAGVTSAAERLERSPRDQADYLSAIRLPDPKAADAEYILRKTTLALLCGSPVRATETLLIVDQFEELFTEDAAGQREAFVNFLLFLTDPARNALPFRVVLTMRADYANALADLPDLDKALRRDDSDDQERGVLRLKALSDEGLKRVVHEPMRLAGHRPWQDRERLFKAIRQDLDRRPGDTALVAVALERLWDAYKKAGGSKDLLAAYQDIGRIAGALANQAKQTIDSLSASNQALLDGLWARLVRPGEGRDPVRRIAELQEFDPARQKLARSLAEADHGRLLLATDTTVDIAHEALFAQWSTLRDFVRIHYQPLRHLGWLMIAAEQWHSEPGSPAPPKLSLPDRVRLMAGWRPPTPDGRSPALERGLDLDLFAELATRHPDWLTERERAFVEASEAEAVRQASNDKWNTQALKAVAAGAVTAFVTMTVLTWISFSALEKARTQEERANREAIEREQALELAVRERERAKLAAIVATQRALQAEANSLWTTLLAGGDWQRAVLKLADVTSDDLRKQFVIEMFKQPDLAERFAKDADITRALIGLSNKRRNDLVQVMVEEAKKAEPHASIAKALAQAAAVTRDTTLAALSVEIATASPTFGLPLLTQLADTLQEKFPASDIRLPRHLFLEAFQNAKSPESLPRLAKNISYLNPTPAEATDLLGKLMAQYRAVGLAPRTIEYLLSLSARYAATTAVAVARTAIEIAPWLPAKESARAFVLILDAYSFALSTPAMPSLGDPTRIRQAFAILGSKLSSGSNQDSAQAFGELLGSFDVLARAERIGDLSSSVAAFWSQLNAHQATEVATLLIEVLRRPGGDINRTRALGRALAALAPKLDEQQRSEARTLLQEALPTSDSWHIFAEFVSALVALGASPGQKAYALARLETSVSSVSTVKDLSNMALVLAATDAPDSAVTRAMGQLIFFSSAFFPSESDAETICDVIITLGPRLPKGSPENAQALDHIIGLYGSRSTAMHDDKLINAIGALVPKLDAAQIDKAHGTVIEALKSTKPPTVTEQFARALIAFKFTASQLAPAMDNLSDRLLQTGGWVELAQAITALGPSLANTPRLVDGIVEFVGKTREADKLIRYVQTIAALPPDPSADSAVVALVYELLKLPWISEEPLARALISRFEPNAKVDDPRRWLIAHAEGRFAPFAKLGSPPQADPKKIAEAVRDAVRHAR
jgi:hypothetical protein